MSFKAWAIAAVCALALAGAGRVAFVLYDQHHQIKALTVGKQLAEKERDTAVKANAANTATIERMEAQKRIDDETVTALSLAVTKVRQGATTVRETIREVERHDPNAAALLATPLPDGVRNALNGH